MSDSNCAECDMDIDGIMDDTGSIYIEYYDCEYCERAVCWNCEEKHIETKCGSNPELWSKFYCQGCGQDVDKKRLAPEQSEYCVECQEKWEVAQESAADQLNGR